MQGQIVYTFNSHMIGNCTAYLIILLLIIKYYYYHFGLYNELAYKFGVNIFSQDKVKVLCSHAA